MDLNPFPDLSISSSEFLDDLSSRSICPKCQRSRKYYCYTCYVPVDGISGQVPTIKLPIKVDIIKHPSEVDGKSTAAHAAVISPDDVTIYTYPCIPDYSDKEKVVLVFPGNLSMTLEELAQHYKPQLAEKKPTSGAKRKQQEEDNIDESSECKTSITSVKTGNVTEKKIKLDDGNQCSSAPAQTSIAEQSSIDDQPKDLKTNLSVESDQEANVKDLRTDLDEAGSGLSREQCLVKKKAGADNSACLERVIFIDSTWNQSKTICRDERLKGLRCVELKTRITQFWRHQKDIPNTYLSTIEAIYYFLRDYHQHFISPSYCSQYDNLLFFFVYIYRKIRSLYNGGKELKAYKEREEKKSHKCSQNKVS